MKIIKGWMHAIYRRVGWGLIATAALLAVGRCVLPYLPFAQWLPDDLQYETITPIWSGWYPGLALTAVTLSADPAMAIAEADVYIDWLNSLRTGTLRLKHIHLYQLEYQWSNADASAMGPLFDLKTWQQAQNTLKQYWQRCPQIVIQDAHIGQAQHLRLQLTLAEKLSVQGAGEWVDTDSMAFNLNVTLHDWQSDAVDGEVYLNVFGLPIAMVTAQLPDWGLPTVEQGRTAFEAWVRLNDNAPIQGAVQFEAFDVQVQQATAHKNWDYLAGTLGFTKTHHRTAIWGDDFLAIANEARCQDKHQAAPSDFHIVLEPTRMAMTLHSMPLQGWGDFLADLAWMPETARNSLQAYQPTGYLAYLHLEALPNFEPIAIHAHINELAMTAPGWPHLAGADTTLVYHHQQGLLKVSGPHLQVQVSPAQPPVSVFNPHLQLHWLAPERILTFEQFQGQLSQAPFEVQGTMALTESPTLAIQAKIEHVPILLIQQLLPTTYLPTGLVTWLQSSLQTGQIVHANLDWQGALDAFPYQASSGQFKLQTLFEGLTLKYAPEWPALTDLSGQLAFEGASLHMKATQGKIADSPLQAAAWIADLRGPGRELIVQADTESTLETALNVINTSPLAATLGQQLTGLSGQGPMALSMKLEMPLPLRPASAMDVKGVLSFKDSRLLAPQWQLDIQQLKGDINFDRSRLSSHHLMGSLWGADTAFRVERTLEDDIATLHINAAGAATPEVIHHWLPTFDLTSITGETHYTADLTLQQPGQVRTGQLVITSDLSGIALALPQPFGKSASHSMPSTFFLSFEPNDVMRLRMQYGGLMSAGATLQSDSAGWAPSAIHAYLGEDALATFGEPGWFKVEGTLPQLNLNQWGPQQAHYPWLQRHLWVKIADLTVADFQFEAVDLMGEYHPKAARWQYQVNGPAAVGHLSLPDNVTQPIRMDFKKLALTKTPTPEPRKLTPTPRPLHFTADKLRYEGKQLSQVNILLEPEAGGYHIKHLHANSYQSSLHASGRWSQEDGALNGHLTSKNISRFLSQWGVSSALQDASGRVNFNLAWEQGTQGIDWSSLNGGLEVGFNQGYLYGIDPGLGRILSLVNIDSLQRRLRLDFTDLSKKALVFDRLNGHLAIKNGILSTQDLYLDGPAARIEFNGHSILENKTLAVQLGILPNVTGGLPIAAAIASGNPAVGAAVWVLDKLIGRQINQMTRYQYQLTGTWQKPHISDVTRTR